MKWCGSCVGLVRVNIKDAFGWNINVGKSGKVHDSQMGCYVLLCVRLLMRVGPFMVASCMTCGVLMVTLSFVTWWWKITFCIFKSFSWRWEQAKCGVRLRVAFSIYSDINFGMPEYIFKYIQLSVLFFIIFVVPKLSNDVFTTKTIYTQSNPIK